VHILHTAKHLASDFRETGNSLDNPQHRHKMQPSSHCCITSSFLSILENNMGHIFRNLWRHLCAHPSKNTLHGTTPVVTFRPNVDKRDDTCNAKYKEMQQRQFLCNRTSNVINWWPTLLKFQLTLWRWYVHSFVIAGRGPAYSGPQRRDHIVVQCTCPGRERELVGVCNVC